MITSGSKDKYNAVKWVVITHLCLYLRHNCCRLRGAVLQDARDFRKAGAERNLERRLTLALDGEGQSLTRMFADVFGQAHHGVERMAIHLGDKVALLQSRFRGRAVRLNRAHAKRDRRRDADAARGLALPGAGVGNPWLDIECQFLPLAFDDNLDRFFYNIVIIDFLSDSLDISCQNSRDRNPSKNYGFQKPVFLWTWVS